jgi:NTE family protein
MQELSMSAPISPLFAGAQPKPDKPTPQKLKPDDIRYLVLEGGGGKGFAYLGAIDILERVKGTDGRNVMARVEGFAGASAGAITAMLLSIGYNYKALTKFLAETNFDEFFDPPRPRIVPQVRTSGVPVNEDSPAEKYFINGDFKAFLEQVATGGDVGIGAMALSASLNSLDPLFFILQQVQNNIVFALHRANLPKVAQILIDQARYYFAYWPRDMGFFSGQAARNLFERTLQLAAVSKQGGLSLEYANMTFEQHWNIFRKRLLVTGTNLRSGKTQLFSRDDTPSFPVADAVRISMGLPWVFKPYVITQRLDDTDPPCGVYVDGGVWNNLPFRELDSNPPAEEQPASAVVPSKKTSKGPTPRTLGLRLGIDPAPQIDSIVSLTLQMLSHGVLGSGESQVLDKYVSQCILLDVRGLDLLSFSPPKDPNDNLRISNRSRRAVCRYFDIDIDAILVKDENGRVHGIRDDDDDRRSFEEKQKAETCG